MSPRFQYFKESNPTSRYDRATAVYDKALKDGRISEFGELNFAVGDELSSRAKSGKAKLDAEKTPGTQAHLSRKASEQKLLVAMDGSGRFYTEPEYDRYGRRSGTKLMWRGDAKSVDFRGPVVLASSKDPKAGVSDFQKPGVTTYFDFAEGLRRNQFTERFHDLYFAVFGVHAPTYPTPDEVKALHEYGKVQEAWKIHSGGDPRNVGKEERK